MGRKHRKSALDVYVGTRRVGVYSRAADGSISFQYDPIWITLPQAFPISLSFPLSDRVWSGASAAGFFDGLLPDNPMMREKIAVRERTDSADPFDLLSVIGRDCVGALRFIPQGTEPGDPSKMTYKPLSEDEISRRIASLDSVPFGMRADEDFRISIAGFQEKTAFLQIGGTWHLPLGPTPTSHIFKPAIKAGPFGADFSDTPWNEWLCLYLCGLLGLAAAISEVRMFGKNPVIVVERFDRRWKGDVLYRLPQEDMCQALGIPPWRRYQRDGGPGIADILELLNGAAVPREDRLRFMKTQIVFWLLAAIDGHAKNYSIFHTPGGYRLTPVYDVISAAPYPELSEHKIKLSMSVGNNRHYRIREIRPRHFYQTGQKAGLRSPDLDDLFSELAARVPDAIESANTLASRTGVPAATYEPILVGIHKRVNLFR